MLLDDCAGVGLIARSLRRYAAPLLRSSFSRTARIATFDIELHSSRAVRWSTIAGNMRVHRLIDEALAPGETFVDVGAHVGYNTLYAARRTGPTGRVIAIEPAPDNLALLQRHVSFNRAGNVTVHSIAAGDTVSRRPFYMRGRDSAVNSLAPRSCYGPVTSILPITVKPLDDVIDEPVHVIKIDIEGSELSALYGMERLLHRYRPRLIVEWHPFLQVAAGYDAEDLPRWFFQRGLEPRISRHSGTGLLFATDVPAIARRLLRRRLSVELST